MDTLGIVIGAAWPVLSALINWAVTELVNTHFLEKFGMDDNNVIVHWVSYILAAVLGMVYLLVAHLPMTSFVGVVSLISATILGKWGASHVADATSQSAASVNPGPVTVNK